LRSSFTKPSMEQSAIVIAEKWAVEFAIEFAVKFGHRR
jgi:hypothetical protein